MASTSSQDAYDIAIIGGGCAGALTVIQLARACEAGDWNGPLSVALIDESGHPGRGVAYSTKCRQHLLNVPATGMSAFPDRPEHFVKWLKERLPESRPETFAPRMIYGDYIEELLRHALRSAGATNVHFSLIEDGAVSISQAKQDDQSILLATGKRLTAAAIVLAPGNFPPERSKFSASMLTSTARFHDNPWASDLSASVAPDDDVLLIGTGLTMIDVILELREAGHRGRYHALSRHGFLPQPHYDYESLAREKPTNFLHIPEHASLSAAFRAMRQAARHAEKENEGKWRCVMTELRSLTARVWTELDLADKRRFLRHVRQLWEIHRHRMAPEIAAHLKELQEAGLLNVLAARILSIVPERNGLSVSFRARGNGEKSLHVAHVINCTGPETDFRQVAHPLIASLRKDGILLADELGLGASVDANGAAIDAHNETSERLFTIGSLRKGNLWESTAVPEIRGQASALSKLLLEKLAARRSHTDASEQKKKTATC